MVAAPFSLFCSKIVSFSQKFLPRSIFVASAALLPAIAMKTYFAAGSIAASFLGISTRVPSCSTAIAIPWVLVARIRGGIDSTFHSWASSEPLLAPRVTRLPSVRIASPLSALIKRQLPDSWVMLQSCEGLTCGSVTNFTVLPTCSRQHCWFFCMTILYSLSLSKVTVFFCAPKSMAGASTASTMANKWRIDGLDIKLYY